MTKLISQKDLQSVFELFEEKIFNGSTAEDHSKQFDRLFFQWIVSESADEDFDRDQMMFFYFQVKHLLECIQQRKHPDDVKVFSVSCNY